MSTQTENAKLTGTEARAMINRQRRWMILVNPIVLSLLFFGAFMWSGSGASIVPVFVVFAFVMTISFLQALVDRCPGCRENIASLPNEGPLRLPKLSRKVRCCPYCGADFSDSPDSPDAPPPPPPAEPTRFDY